ncbi:MAG: biosynthetic arginine decarboxylase [Bdellovibrionaceae bacterium]|nr:biosynthetic arginine decarboxylase [Pseudobdellovibrionaceae bacterium]
MTDWTVEDSKTLYGISNWGAPYFNINSKGNVTVDVPEKGNPVDLKEIIDDLKANGIQTPVLMRFPDILSSRIKLLNRCFQRAMTDYGYTGKYRGVFPVKVNQQKHLVEDLVKFGEQTGLGLECGSKPELIIAITKMKYTDGLILCNGFKDRDYIETALLATKLGRDVIIVVDRKSELDIILQVAKELEIKPTIGLRAKLSTRSAGRWVESTGHKSKFGLTPFEMVECVERLKAEDMQDSLQLIHFHLGSQIPSILSIKASLKEGTRFFTELYNLGVTPKYIDVGGGLGVDYDGSGSTESSTNYSEQEYANDVVYTIKSICDEKKVPHPDIITESGRSLVAHSSVLVFDVLGCNNFDSVESHDFKPQPTDHQILRDLYDISEGLSLKTLNEGYNDLKQIRADILQLFTYGVLNLEQRAIAERLIFNISSRMRKLIRNEEDFADILYELDSFLCDSYFCNFSVFQSLPDSWAVDQIFPILPIMRHKEHPDRRAIIVDLTCDSDGKVNRFIDSETYEVKSTLEVHSLKPNEPYYIGAFLAGAYQEILGDLHNLFGDTNAVHIHISENGGYTIDHIVQGDSMSDVLSYVEYNPEEFVVSLNEDCMNGISKGTLTEDQAALLMKRFKTSLFSSTYLGS